MLHNLRSKMVLYLVLAAILALVITTVALASVTFNVNNGTGFVGKGDVQTIFGWNNAELQQYGDQVVFSYEDEVVLSQECVREAGNSGTKYKTAHRSRGVNAAVTYFARKNPQDSINGYTMLGYAGGSTFDGGPLPTDICPDSNPNPAEPVWSPVGPVVVESSSVGGLYVTFNGIKVLLWSPVVP